MFELNGISIFCSDLNALIKYESGNASKPNTAVNVQMPLCKECRGSGRTEILVNLNQMQSSNETSPKQEKENVDRHNSHEKNRPIVEIRAQERAQERAQQAYKNKYSRCAKSNSVFVKNTAIDLYRKYQHDWKKFKTNIPGENSREDLRKEVREKSLKQPPPKPTVIKHLHSV